MFVIIYTTSPRHNIMQTAQRCSCSFRTLELFVRDFAGLEVRHSRLQTAAYKPAARKYNIYSNRRLFSTRSAFGIQNSDLQRAEATATSPVPVQDVSDGPNSTSAESSHDSITQATIEPSTQTLDVPEGTRSRVEGRKERKVRRLAAKKAAEQEAKEEIQKAKRAVVAAERKKKRSELGNGEDSSAKAGEKSTKRNLPAKVDRKQEGDARYEAWKSQRETWKVQKSALQDKFGEQNWQPRKRISPDALSGIRTMHNQQPHIYTTEVLADHFKVSPEAIRRILKSKWQPDEETSEDRRSRWEKRGEKKWKEMVELGIRPPKKWREMGVGKAAPGEVPAWKKGGVKEGSGERWIEHPETDAFVVAGDMVSEQASMEPASIGDRIL